jgi:hypothetical protein
VDLTDRERQILIKALYLGHLDAPPGELTQLAVKIQGDEVTEMARRTSRQLAETKIDAMRQTTELLLNLNRRLSDLLGRMVALVDLLELPEATTGLHVAVPQLVAVSRGVLVEIQGVDANVQRVLAKLDE